MILQKHRAGGWHVFRKASVIKTFSINSYFLTNTTEKDILNITLKLTVI